MYYRFLIQACIFILVLLLGYTSSQAQNFEQTLKALANDRADGDEFGFSVSISGDYAAVGAYREDEDPAGANPFMNAGSVYIFKKGSGDIWAFQQKITPLDRRQGDEFGYSVSISGNYLIVGAWLSDDLPTDLASNEGAAYVFERNTGTDIWEQKAKLVAPVKNIGDQFGISVAITSTGYAIVGASAEDEDASDSDPQTDAGSAYIFERNAGGLWPFKQKIVAPDRAAASNFGNAVAIDQGNVVVAANQHNNTGNAYIFERSGGTWIPKSLMNVPVADLNTGDLFGTSVAIHGEWLVIGAEADDHIDDTGTAGVVSDAGAAYLFHFDGTNWVYRQKIVAKDRGAGDFFGTSVGISNKNVVIGAQNEDEDANNSNSLTNAGSAYIFHLNANNQWVQATKLVANDRAPGAFFGNAVAITKDDLIVGAKNGLDGSTMTGASYIFKDNPFNNGLLFDGINDYIELPNEANFDVTNALTIEAWVRFTGGSLADGQYQSIVTKGNEAWRLRFKGTADPVLLSFDYNGSNELNSTGAPDFKLGNWHHIAIVFDGTTATKSLKMYIDGILNIQAATPPTTNINVNDDPVWIGNNRDESTTYLEGALDDLRIWKKVKGFTEINNFKDCQLMGTEHCLIAYYQFDNNTVPLANNTFITEVTDRTGNNNGTFQGFTLDGSTSNFIDADPTFNRLTTCTMAINLPVARITAVGAGTSISNGSIFTSTADGTDFGELNIGEEITKTFSITNVGAATLNLTGTTPNYVILAGSPNFTVKQQPVAGSISVGSAINFEITFRPTIADGVTTFVTIATNDCAGRNYSFNIGGVGLNPNEINVQDAASNDIADKGTFDAGKQTVGTTITHTFTIQNTGTAALTLTGTPELISITGSPDFSISAQPETASVAASGNTTFTVSFRPTSVGTKTATLTIPNDDSDENPYTITLNGEGTLPEINVLDQSNNTITSGGSIDFGTFTLGNPATTQTFTIQNLGDGALDLTGTAPNLITVAGDAAFSIAAQPTANILNAGTSLTFQVSFKANNTGAKKATITIANNDPDENPYTIIINGQAVAPPNPEVAVFYQGKEIVSGGDLTIDTTAALNTRSLTIYIKNQGNATLNLTGSPLMTLSGTNAGEFSTTTLSTATSIAANDSTSFLLNLTPTSLGDKTARLVIPNGDADEGNYTINLISYAVAPPSQPANVQIQATTLPPTSNTTTRNALTITWQAPTNIDNVTGYRIKRSVSSTTAFTQIAELGLGVNDFLDLNLAEGIQYYYQVFSYNQFGESEPSPIRSLVYVGIEENKRFAQQTVVFPNPTSDKVQVSFPSTAKHIALVEVYTSQGQLLRTQNLKIKDSTVTIDLNNLPNGKYWIQIKVSEHLIYKQVIKK